jgi:hypothetical protein
MYFLEIWPHVFLEIWIYVFLEIWTVEIWTVEICRSMWSAISFRTG